jgi:hypothetical protein
MTIDSYLAQLVGLLTVPPAIREEILQEVRDHLEDSTRQLTESGVARPEAEEQATTMFGNPAQVARRLNAVHPVHWDRKRFGVGVLWGIAATWALWTLLTYPLLVQLAAQNQTLASVDTSSPWSLLFSATPLAFGMFSVLGSYWYWFVPLFLLLYSLTPSLWARQAEFSWQPGLAFGLGVLLGFPWLVPAIIYRWQAWDPVKILLPIGGMWLLVPLAIFAGWLGLRSRGWQPVARISHRAGSLPSPRTRSRITPAVVLTICLGVALLGLNAWSAVRAAGLHAAALPPLSQQIQTAQANLPFALRQPSYVPAGMSLVSVTATPHSCANPCVDLLYNGPHGAWLDVLEIAANPAYMPVQMSAALFSADYKVSQGSGGSLTATWWLGNDITSQKQTNITWEKESIDYTLSTNAAFSTEVLEHVARSLG